MKIDQVIPLVVQKPHVKLILSKNDKMMRDVVFGLVLGRVEFHIT
jgi:hypothetical protein